jgi:hypothetical protein
MRSMRSMRSIRYMRSVRSMRGGLFSVVDITVSGGFPGGGPV